MKRVGILMVLLAMFGCGKPAAHLTVATPAALEGGWSELKNASYPVSFGVAPGWRVGAAPTMDLSGLENMLPSAPGQDPQAAADEAKKREDEAAKSEQKSWEKKGILLLCSDLNKPIPGEMPTQYKLRHETQGGEIDLERGVAIVRSDMKAGEPQFIDTPMGKAGKLTFDMKTIGGDEVHKITYVFVDGKELYSLEFGCTGDNRIKDVADPVMKSLRIQPGIQFAAE